MQPRPYLDSFINFEKNLNALRQEPIRLDRVRGLLADAGDPQEAMTCVQVAGTKGKGTTCAFLAYILRAAGHRTGLYTSPHLQDVTERLRVLEPGDASGGDFEGAITDEELARLVETHRPLLE